MTVRDDREKAYWDCWRAGLRDNPRDALPAFLDALEAIDQAHNLSELPRTGAEYAEWVLPAQAEGAPLSPAEAAQANPAIPERVKPPAPARPATRRRTRA